MKKSLKILCLALCCILLLTGTVLGAQLTDIKGHWAEPQIVKWVDKGLIYGNSDGTFRPNNPITRAEFSALANRAFGFTASDTVTFSDVKADAWYAKDVSIAKAAGYITGYGDGSFKPMAYITRQEAAAMISRILKLDAQAHVEAASHFADYSTFPAWSKGYIGAVYVAECMKGYSDNTFRGAKNITRAEAVITLDNAFTKQSQSPGTVEPGPATTFGTVGIYGPDTGTNTINGDVVISAAGVTLRNTIIDGDLLLAQSIGSGNVTLTNVTVTGTTTIKGGGGNSIFLTDCNMPTVVVDKSGVRIVASGKTSVKLITLESGAILVEVTSGDAGFEQVVVSETLPANTKITLSGTFENVTLDSPVQLLLTSTSHIDTLVVNSSAYIANEGTIGKAIYNASGFNVEYEIENFTVADGVSGTVEGETVAGESTGGGGGGGGGGSLPAVSSENVTLYLSDGTSDPITVSVTPTNNGLTVTFDLTDPSLSGLYITKVHIDTPAGAKLVPSQVTSANNVNYEMYQDDLEEAIEGMPRDIPISELLGTGNNEVYVSTLKSIFGDWVTVSGTLSAQGYSSRTVTLTLELQAD